MERNYEARCALIVCDTLAKSRDLLQQIEILQQVHERHLDQKTDAVESLEKDMQEAEGQLTTAIKSHLINIDTLIDLQSSRLASLQRQYETDLGQLDAEFTTER